MYARFDDDVVVELFNTESLEGMFPPEFTAKCRECSAATKLGDYWNGTEIVDGAAHQAELDALSAKESIYAQLNALDLAAIRPLRAIQVAQAAGETPDQMDVARLAELEAQVAAVRAKL